MASLTSGNYVQPEDFRSDSEKHFAGNDGWEAVAPWSAKSIQVPHDPQSFESQMRPDDCDLGHPAGNKARITTSRDDGNFFARKLLRFDSRQNLPNQSTVTEDDTGTHSNATARMGRTAGQAP